MKSIILVPSFFLANLLGSPLMALLKLSGPFSIYLLSIVDFFDSIALVSTSPMFHTIVSGLHISLGE
jgi:hypothetical protein